MLQVLIQALIFFSWYKITDFFINIRNIVPKRFESQEIHDIEGEIHGQFKYVYM